MANIVSFYAQDPKSGEVRSVEVDLDAIGSGGGSSISWGDIQGDIRESAQIDDFLDQNQIALDGLQSQIDLKIETELDPVFSASPAAGISSTNISNWNAAFGWGDHGSAGYITNLSGFSTTNLAEGSNLYFTEQRVLDAINNLTIDADTLDGIDSTGFVTVLLDGGRAGTTFYSPNNPNFSLVLSDSNELNLSE